MATHSALHGDLTSGLSLTFRGVEYKPRLIVQEIKEKAEEWLEAEARKGILKWKGLLSASEFMELVREHEDNCNSGVYTFNGEVCQAALARVGGGVFLVSVLFGCDEATAMAMMVDIPEEVQLILAAIKGKSSPNA